MTLVVKLELEKNKENYQAVLKALEEFDIASASWEDEVAAQQVQVTVPKDSADIGSKLSAAITRINNVPK